MVAHSPTGVAWLACLLACQLMLAAPARGAAAAAAAADEPLPDEVQRLFQQAGRLYREAKYAQAIALCEKFRDEVRRLRGEEHPDYATALNDLAGLYMNVGDFARAEPLQLQSLAIRKAALGEDHPHYALSLSNLAGLYHSRG